MFHPELQHTIVCPAAAQGGASFPATVFNLVNVIMGAGYVSIPYACRQVSLGGWGRGGEGRAACWQSRLPTDGGRQSATLPYINHLLPQTQVLVS
jgi:hypothetical protein